MGAFSNARVLARDASGVVPGAMFYNIVHSVLILVATDIKSLNPEFRVERCSAGPSCCDAASERKYCIAMDAISHVISNRTPPER